MWYHPAVNNFKYWESLAQSSFGRPVSVKNKRKTLNKFGRTLRAGGSTRATLSVLQGNEVNETYATGNSVDRVVSTSGSDSGSITIEGHTVDTVTGALSFVAQTATLAGQTPVALATPLHRAVRMYRTPGTWASPATELVGTVAAYDSTLATSAPSGVPDDDTATKITIPAGDQSSFKAETSMSNTDFWFIDQVNVGLQRDSGGASVTVEAWVEWRQQGGVWRVIGNSVVPLRNGSHTQTIINMSQPLIIPPNADVRMRCLSAASVGTLTMQGSMSGPIGVALA